VRQFCTDDRRSTDAKGGNTMKSLFRVALVFAALVAFAAPASAQSIQADPPAVPEAGTYDFTISGTGFSEPGFVLPCPGANGDPAQINETSCDVAALTPYSDGEFSVSVTYDIPAEGLVVVAGNAAQSESGATVIVVGDLPNTGSNTNLYVTVGLVLAAAAAALVLGGRRLQQA